ncbi:MAG: carbohydrate ABC transporter substrate-binding protein, partial [Pseudomonadota bacterium]|nr:carbohydrate ABC transporter substrate-binding protein [Pseudomonadota bacterium]
GIAVSRRCTMSEDLRAHLLMLMSDTAQRGLIPDNDGQPGLAAAWADPRVNAAWGTFYADTSDTLRAAAIRPRHNGYIAFQTAASAHLRESFSARCPAAQAVDELARMFHASTGKVPA